MKDQRAAHIDYDDVVKRSQEDATLNLLEAAMRSDIGYATLRKWA